MIRVGITGSKGFIGSHLINTIKFFSEEFEIVNFEKEFFEDERLIQFVSKCDVIVHLAAVNRHADPAVIYNTNTTLIKLLIDALDKTDSKAHVIFSSSSQEDRGGLYGQSKRDGRELFIEWVNRSQGKFTGMVIPNVYGPFGNPFYNSFIATFCHLLTHGGQPTIETDSMVKLIFVDDVVKIIIDVIRTQSENNLFYVPHTDEREVSDVLAILEHYKDTYYNEGVIPALSSRFEINLFNTFRSYIDCEQHFPVKFIKHADQRGTFTEIIRLNVGGQVSFSVTLPGITRGNHFHTHKIERFAVIKGNALIQLRRMGTDKVIEFYLSGDVPAYVDMPIWYTHNIQNIGSDELYTIFWINEFFDPNNPDTYFENV